MTLAELSLLRKEKRQILILMEEYNDLEHYAMLEMLANALDSINEQIRELMENEGVMTDE